MSFSFVDKESCSVRQTSAVSNFGIKGEPLKITLPFLSPGVVRIYNRLKQCCFPERPNEGVGTQHTNCIG